MQKYMINAVKRREFMRKLKGNFVWHLVSTEDQVKRMYQVLDQFSLKGLFFVAANLVERSPWRLQFLSKHEVAPHGYYHNDYSKMNGSEGKKDMQLAWDTFISHGITPTIFRAPYATPRFNDNSSWYSMLKSVGFHYSSSELCDKPPFFPKWKLDGMLELPIIYPTEDALITYEITNEPRGMTKELLRVCYKTQEYVKRTQQGGNFLIYCLHPLRIGQEQYIPVLENLLHGIDKLPDFELASFSSAIKRWNEGDKTNLVVISGDIDCWTFVDYIRRLKYE